MLRSCLKHYQKQINERFNFYGSVAILIENILHSIIELFSFNHTMATFFCCILNDALESCHTSTVIVVNLFRK